ncbi:hypothetical protein SAMN05444398_10611 [Roseovarius pacificus]|uniref:Uncharacterized protein n=1 Tax=Roseovarius pacificus TaxID=337701 RepID=A0A1M7DR16_9RHOB|nr:hypothetical protein SAMN05444398_10611 [Roseovarius pacificus]
MSLRFEQFVPAVATKASPHRTYGADPHVTVRSAPLMASRSHTPIA